MQENRVTVNLGQQLHGRLRAQAQLDGRHLQYLVLYLVEAMLGVAAKQGQGFRLRPEASEKINPNLSIKLQLSAELEKQVSCLANSYGLSKPQLIKILLNMGLDLLTQSRTKGLIRKEEFEALAQEAYGSLAAAR